MTYASLEKQLRALPESSLADVSRYVEFLIYKEEQAKKPASNLKKFYGSMPQLQDGLVLQRNMRDEWD